MATRHFMGALLLAAGAALGPTQAQTARDFRELKREVERMQEDILALREGSVGPFGSVEGGGTDVGLQARLDALELEVRRLTDRVERADFRLERLESEFRTFAQDMEFRMAERPLSNPPARSGPSEEPGSRSTDQDPTATTSRDPFGAQPSLGDQPSSPPPGARDPLTRPSAASESPSAPVVAAPGSAAPSDGVDPDILFERAREDLFAGDLARADAAFAGFLDAHPDHPLALEARYWRGEALFAQGRHGEAAQLFLEAAREDADHPRASESYLKLGMALDALGEGREACEVFADLPNRFPEAGRGVMRRLEIARDSAACN